MESYKRSNIQVNEMSYMRGSYDAITMDSEKDGNAYRRFGMACKGKEMSCIVVSSILRWFGHLEKVNESQLTRIYEWNRWWEYERITPY